ncbi:MAG: glycosyltransferase family 2 protein [Lachnospiraceae bacterium]|jgi:glycosyltransferase involved in cell wall biosynthesis|nr:glycosyltransferase family 2 protein [Lachnospiraceae bacterium]
MKKISIGICCFNESKTVNRIYEAVKKEMDSLENYDYEIVFADNASTDGTREILRDIAKKDCRVKVILNQTNVGIQKSGANMMSHLSGDAYIGIPCDFQEPPEMLPEFIKYWEQGYHIVWGQKTASKENRIKYFFRSIYYKIIKLLSNTPQYEQVTGFGIQDMRIIKEWLELGDPTISLRNIIGEWGYEVKLVPYIQNKRKEGKSSYTIGKLLTFAINSLVNTSLIPLRLVTLLGLFSSFISLLIGTIYLVYKVTHWTDLSMGMAPMLIGLFFLGSVQLFSIGIIGEYIGVTLRRISKHVKVIEEELINFD